MLPLLRAVPAAAILACDDSTPPGAPECAAGPALTRPASRPVGEAEFSAEKLAAMSWQQAWQEVARTMFGALSRHSNVAPLLAREVPIGPNAMALRERCIAVLLDSGFPRS